MEEMKYETVRTVICPTFLSGERKWQSPDGKFMFVNFCPPSYKMALRVEIKEGGKKIITISPLNRIIKEKKALMIYPFSENGSVEWISKIINLNERLL